ncbi:MAG: hypothetical protein KAT65_22995 [Methanophagales archaeon]|jgi:hypothetical protein|nr:hypothetical protein [Methanophagales archaeon]
MIGVRPEGYICKTCSDIRQNWMYILNKFGYTEVRRAELPVVLGGRLRHKKEVEQ